MDIDISKYDKADVLAALYNNSKSQGMGFLHFNPVPMSRDEASSLLQNQSYFDYLNGRVIKVNLSGSILRSGLYDRDNGIGAAQVALNTISK